MVVRDRVAKIPEEGGRFGGAVQCKVQYEDREEKCREIRVTLGIPICSECCFSWTRFHSVRDSATKGVRAA